MRTTGTTVAPDVEDACTWVDGPGVDGPGAGAARELWPGRSAHRTLEPIPAPASGVASPTDRAHRSSSSSSSSSPAAFLPAPLPRVDDASWPSVPPPASASSESSTSSAPRTGTHSFRPPASPADSSTDVAACVRSQAASISRPRRASSGSSTSLSRPSSGASHSAVCAPNSIPARRANSASSSQYSSSVSERCGSEFAGALPLAGTCCAALPTLRETIAFCTPCSASGTST